MKYTQNDGSMVPMPVPLVQDSRQIFRFNGSPDNLIAKVQSLSPQELQQMNDINLTINGDEIKGPNNCCMIWTIIIGSMLIFPLFFICCGWWKKIVNGVYQIPYQAYECIGKLLKSKNVSVLTINVIDNAFDKKKSQILFDHLLKSSVKIFTFNNLVQNFNNKASQYDDFVQNMQPIKGLKILTTIKWFNDVVI